MELLLKTLLAENFAIIDSVRDYVKRPFKFSEADNFIKVAIGVRRCGKTIFLYQTINELLDQGISKEQILILNLEDDRLLPMNFKEMGKFLDEFYSLYPENHSRRCYLFLDEVQNITGWYHVVRRFFDTKKTQIYLTGSSSKLLSTEINTSLRGRSLSVEVWPYSFQEYLEINNIPAASKPFGQASFDIMQKHLLRYFSCGGFPGMQDVSEDTRARTLQGYVDTVMLRDVIERHQITHITLLKYFTSSLLKNAATIFSINKFYNDAKSQGYAIGKETIHHYLSYIEDSFLIFTVPNYSESERIKQTKSKKIYVVDIGLINAVSFSANSLYGKLFENLIFLDLRKQNKLIYYYTTKEGYEVDFVTVDRTTGKRELIQVTWDMSDTATMDREQRALLAAENELKIKGRIITPLTYLSELSWG
ncbi:MAG: ATP-binding protein [Gammaproteobacteria bacterium]|nr:ATP-binding protein [Gammaproteobacteria bacterium]